MKRRRKNLRQLASRPINAVAPVGLKPPPRHPPRRLATTNDVVKLQRLMTNILVRPLTKTDGLQPIWIDGRPMTEVAEEFIKPNDRLSAFERLQLYNRMYWFRLIDIMHDDNPGIRAVLGDKKFTRLIEAYLTKYPSRSFTLRNLCSRLAQFIREEPRWTAPHTSLAQTVARFEWAQTLAFDEAKLPVLTADDISKTPPERLRLRLQPYLSLLALDYPVDSYVIAVKQRNALRTEASNAVDSARDAVRQKHVKRPRRQRVYVGVHRLDNRLYYKRLDRPAFLILQAIAAGQSLAEAITAGGRRVKPAEVGSWFSIWMELGWLCRRK
jgi:hypothetical protein